MSSYLLGGGQIVLGVDPLGIGVSIGVTHLFTLFCKPVLEFLPNFYGYTIGT